MIFNIPVMQIPAQPQQQGHKKQRLWTLKLPLTCSMSTMETLEQCVKFVPS